MIKKNYLVSVIMITYGHEKFIAEAIRGVLNQKTSFNFELIIADDNSPDCTRSIVEEIIKSHPKGSCIKYIQHAANKGMMGNFIWAINQGKGKYISLCEGDDYWIESTKLQNQVELLEQDNKMSVCFHNAQVIYETGRQGHPFAKLDKRFYNGQEIIKNWLIPTASIVFRNHNIKWPNFSEECAHGDILLFLLLFEEGRVFGLDQVWSIYRKNDKSVTAINHLNPSYILKIIKQLTLMNEHFDFKYSTVLNKRLQHWRLALLKSFLVRRKYLQFIKHSLLLSKNDPSFFKSRVYKLLLN